MTVNRAFLQTGLHALLRALAAPGRVALEHEPEGMCRPDELALDFDNYYSAFVGNFGEALTAAQRDHLARLDALLSAMSGQSNAALWTELAVGSHARWEEVRLAAKQALDVLGWSVR